MTYIAGMFTYVQQQNAIQATERARIDAQAKDEREWGLAALNLSVLAAVAPKAVKGVLNAERSRIPAPGGPDESNRLERLAAVAGVQDALAKADPSGQAPASSFKPSDFTIYVQYAEGGRDTAVKAQGILVNLGYRVPGIEQVGKVPSRLEVRYYRPDQRSCAGELAAELGKGPASWS